MAEIPDYQTLMLPVLRIAALGESSIPKAVEKLGVEFGQGADLLETRGWDDLACGVIVA
jgi:restriction system protein